MAHACFIGLFQEEYGCQVFLTGRDSIVQLHRVEVGGSRAKMVLESAGM